MMLRMMMSRERKISMLVFKEGTMMMLRRKTGPKTGTHSLFVPVQSKSASRFHNRHQKTNAHGNLEEKYRGPD